MEEFITSMFGKSFDKFTLSDIPIKFRTKEICIAAVKIDPLAIASVPADLLSQEIFNLQFATHGTSHQLPKELDREYCLKAVKIKGMNLQCVPYALRDWEMCIAAVNQNPRAASYFPEELLKYYKLCGVNYKL